MAISPVQESQLIPRSFVEEGILVPSGMEGEPGSAIRVEEEPGALMVKLSGVFVTDDSSKLRPRGIPLPEDPNQRIKADLSLGFSMTDGNLVPSEGRQNEVISAIEQAGIVGKRIDTHTLNELAEVVTRVTNGLIVFPDQDATSGVVQVLVVGTTVTSAAPVIGAITVMDTGEGSKVVVESLRGIFIAAKPEEVPQGIKLPAGIRLSQNAHLPKDSLKSLERYFGKPITLGMLRKISREIVGIYAKNGIPVVDVAIPDQEISNNVVTLVAVEGRVGKIEEKGGNWISEAKIAETFTDHGVAPGEILRQQGLKEALEQLNATGFRRADVVLRPGKSYGESDVIVNVRDRFPARFYWGWNNTGTKSLDTERWFAGFNWSEPLFDFPQIFSYQYQAAPDIDLYWSQSGSYQMWLPWGHRILLYGSLSESQPIMTLAASNLKGESQTIGGHYTVPFESIVSDDNKWVFEHSLIGGFDYKNSNSDLTFAGVQVFTQAIDIGEFVASYDTKLTDALGYTRVCPTLIYSPGSLFENNTETAFLLQRPGSDPNYGIFALTWERSFNLPENFEFNTSGRYQVSSSNLVGVDQMGLGGSSTIRGFPERFVAGDEGYYIMSEMRCPPLAMAKLAGFSSNDLDSLIFYGFFDYGEVGPYSYNNASTITNETLSSAGLGFRYKLSSYLTMELSYGFRLMTPQVGDAGGQALSYSFTLAY